MASTWQAKYTSGTSIPANERRSYLRESFAGYDRNRSGFITCDEVMEVWKKCLLLCNENVQAERVENEAKRFMAVIDKDNNGRISFEEYVNYFENLWTQKEAKHRSQKLNQPSGTQTTSPSDRSGRMAAPRAQPLEQFQSNAKRI